MTDKENNIEELLVKALIRESGSKLQESITNKLSNMEEEMNDSISKISDKLRTKMAVLENQFKEIPKTINIGTVEKPSNKLVHSAFDTIIKVLNSSKRINKNIMLVGPCASGKSSLCEDVASYYKLDFYPMSVGLQTTKSDLLGFINAKGDYVTSPVRQAFENGGVLLLDEFDATHAGTVTILNGMLANDICAFPDKIVRKHKDFICIVACNTYGRGATLEFTGRNRLDTATLDRFICIQVNYDESLEKKLTNNDGWFRIIKNIRRNIDKHGLKVAVSPRASMQGADLLDAGFDINDVLEMVVYKGSSDEVKSKLMQGVDVGLVLKKEQKKVEKGAVADVSTPIEVNINFDTKKYSLTNIVENTSIVENMDWEGKFNIYMSSSSEWISSLTDTSLYLNYGKDNSFTKDNFLAENISKLIRELTDYSDTCISDLQQVKLTIIYQDVEYHFTLG